jgi:pimeloyl-ACP methyl ester carboxylesterase
VGVLTEAAAGSPAEGRPGVIFLNSGILHRVGSCRLHVRLARAMSAAGFHALRFDYSGIGDSDQRRDSLPFEESAVLETKEAMDYLAKAKGVQKFILIGLCSGADMAHETALRDERVAGLMLLDAWAYRNPGYYMHHYGPKLLNVNVWRNSIGIRLKMLRGTYTDTRACIPGTEGVEYDVPKYVRVFPPKERIGADLRTFVKRGIEMRFVWTGGLEEYNHEGQYASTFRDVGLGKLFEEAYMPDADHILTGLDHQDQVIDRTLRWAAARWPAQNAGTSAAVAAASAAPAAVARPASVV